MRERPYLIKLNDNHSDITANDLMLGLKKMPTEEARLLYMAMVQIAVNEDIETYIATIEEISKITQESADCLQKNLEFICADLLQRAIKVQSTDSEGKISWEIIHWVDYAKYTDNRLEIYLSEDIKPYLSDFAYAYKQSSFQILFLFKSYYAMRLYQTMFSDAIKTNGKNREWFFTCEEIRNMFSIKQNQYKQNNDLILHTILSALKELHNSDYCIIYNYKKRNATIRGKLILGVSFNALLFDNAEKKKQALEDIKKGRLLNREDKMLGSM